MDDFTAFTDDTRRAVLAFLCAMLDGDAAGQDAIMDSMPAPLLIGGLAGIALSVMRDVAERDGYADDPDAAIRAQLAGFLAAHPPVGGWDG